MIQNYAVWFESDRLNPITVRDLRRLRRFWYFEIITLLVLFGLCAAFYGVLNYSEFNRYEMGIAFTVIPLIAAWIPQVVAMFYPSGSAQMLTQKDDLFDVVPMSPREQVHGHMMTAFTLSVFGISLALPFVAATYLIGAMVGVELLALAGTMIFVQILNLVGLAFLARVKSQWGVALAVILGVYVCGPCIEAPWIGVVYLLDVVLTVSPPTPSTGLFVLIGIGVFFAAALLAVVSYRLAVFQFAHRNAPLWKGLCVNIGVYTLLSTLFAAVFLCVCLLFFQ